MRRHLLPGCSRWRPPLLAVGPAALPAGAAAAIVTVAGVAGMASAVRPPKGGKAGRGHRWRGSRVIGLLSDA